MRHVTVDRRLPGDPDTVFEWFVDPVLLTRWWPSEAETDPVDGGSYRMYWAGPDVTLRGRYVAVQPGSRLAFTWSWDHDDLPPRTVELTFSEADAGTLVTVVHEAETDDETGDYADGWTHFLSELASSLAGA